MRIRTILLSAATAALVSVNVATACNKCETISAEAPAVLFENVTALHHPVTTTNAEAQKYFDQGLTLVFAFNHDEAIRSFKQAAELDPKCAMAWWGVALALGPNYNFDVTPEGEVAAYEAIQKALKLKDGLSQVERDYIDALAVRYTDQKDPDLKKLAAAYAVEMKKVHEKYPDDLDAATLYAESMMVLRPWRLWTYDGKAEEGTPLIVATLEWILRRDPNHVGANHLYIHAVEGSTEPERALPSADRLPGLSPGSGHLVHMPSHIYQRCGDYNSAATTNESAIRVDDEYFRTRPRIGAYAAMYYNHNVHFASWAHSWQGNYESGKRFAKKLYVEILPMIPDMPPLEMFSTFDGMVALHFADWDALLAMPKPAESLKITRALWHFERAMALTEKGRDPEAEQDRAKFLALRNEIPSDTLFGMLNNTGDIFTIADLVLGAKIDEKHGRVDQAVEKLTQASNMQDRMIYEEPAPWPISLKQNLGGVLLRAGRYAEAEKVFRADLLRNPRHGRSLYGLWQAVKNQGRDYDAGMLQRQFNEAWKHADVKVTAEML